MTVSTGDANLQPPTSVRRVRFASRLKNAVSQRIVFDGTHTPIKTFLFIVICAAWVLPGLTGHDPWKPDEALAFGVVHSMLQDGFWLIPTIAGVPSVEYPPLYYWVAAILAKIFSPLLPLHDGARLATGLFMAITLLFTHKTATRLFDARAGRLSVILLLGCLGLLWRGHQLNPELAGLAGMSVALYGMTRIRSEPRQGGVMTGSGAAVIAMSIGIVPALAPTIILLVLMGMIGDWKNRDFQRGIGVALLVALPGMALYPAILFFANAGPLANWCDAISGVPYYDLVNRQPINLIHFLRDLPWYGLPAFPFAMWLWAKDRKKIRDRVELALPFAAFITLLILISFTRKASDNAGLPMLLPLALAAASSPDRLSRSVASFMDWFSLLFFGLFAVAGWLYWTAAVTGAPEAAANAVARQAPGFVFLFTPISFAMAVAFTLLWAYAVLRAHRNNRRAMVNWTAGVTLVWLLASLLGFSAVDHRQSYRATAKTIAAQLPAEGCVASLKLGDAQRASLYYFAGLRFIPSDNIAAEKCQWLLSQGSRNDEPMLDLSWRMIWEGARPGDNDERLRLYRRS